MLITAISTTQKLVMTRINMMNRNRNRELWMTNTNAKTQILHIVVALFFEPTEWHIYSHVLCSHAVNAKGFSSSNILSRSDLHYPYTLLYFIFSLQIIFCESVITSLCSCPLEWELFQDDKTSEPIFLSRKRFTIFCFFFALKVRKKNRIEKSILLSP